MPADNLLIIVIVCSDYSVVFYLLKVYFSQFKSEMRSQVAVRIEIFVNLETNLIFFFLSHIPSSSAVPSFHLALPAEMRRKVRRRRRRRCNNSSLKLGLAGNIL